MTRAVCVNNVYVSGAGVVVDPEASPEGGTVVPFNQWMPRVDIGGLDPALNGKAVCQSNIEAGGSLNPHLLTDAIKTESLAHLTGSKRHASLQNPIVRASLVISIALAWPPSDQSGRRRETIDRKSTRL